MADVRSGEFVVGLLVGALVGTALGLLFAPFSGEESRAKVAEGARHLKETAAEKAGELLKRGKEQEEQG